MSQSILEQNIAQVLGIDTLSPEEQASFLAEVGDTIFQSSLVRLVSSLSEDQQFAFEQYIDTEPEPEVLLQHMLEHYTEFKTILEEVVTEFKEDARAVLQEKEEEIKIIDAG